MKAISWTAGPRLHSAARLLAQCWPWTLSWREGLQWAVALGFSVALAAAVVATRDRWVTQQRAQRLNLEAQNLAALVEAASSKSMVMTGAQMLGVLDNRAKRLARDPRLKSDTAALEDLVTSVQILQARRAAVLDAQGQEVISLDFNGSVVPSEAATMPRPFVEIALAGRKVAYVDIPAERKTRSLHLLAPIYEERSTYSRVIGAYYMEAGVSEVEAALKGYSPRIALVVSPGGQAFVGNLPEAELLTALAPAQEYGMAAPQRGSVQAHEDGITPTGPQAAYGHLRLPPALLSASLAAGSHRYMQYNIASVGISWAASHGEWRCLLLEPALDGADQGFRLALAVAMALGLFGGFVLVSRYLKTQLRHHNAMLEKQQQLTVAIAAANAAVDTKSAFLANMSHEIRTPMNAIIGLSGLALKQEMPPRVQDYLGKIRQSGEHLLRIINDILDFSKIESGKLDMECVPFELESVIDNVVSLISEKAESKGLELLCHFDHAVPKTLLGDPLRIGQILINYANNAVKFTERGELCFSIRVLEARAQDVLLQFALRDTGIGLTEQQIGRLFKSFEQADSSITRQYGGTGLGLAISKSLAEAMGGEVGVQSEYGKGSTFWFSARLGVASADKVVMRPSVDLHGRHVLVVDDNEAAALELSELLSELGFVVRSVNGGPAALQAVAQADAQVQPFDFVLMDWQMPGMDGLETVRRIRQMNPRTVPFVLMVTAHRRQELLKGAKKLGLEHVLAKPISASVLVNTMMQLAGHGPRELPARRRTDNTGLAENALAHLAGARILLVEDNDVNQLVACELLRGAGFLVEVADNGQIAVHQVHARQAQGQPYDIVLMDMQMPVMDGVTAARLIRESFDSQALPIVAMTANAMQVDREHCLAAGMNGFVSKPISPQDLWHALLTWIRPRIGLGLAAALPVCAPAQQASTDTDQSSASWQALRAIAGLDAERGLALANHNSALYLAMLRRFVASQEHSMRHIREALEQRDLATAERLAHTLKGLAGSLGAHPLCQCAAELEAAVRAGRDSATLDNLLRRAGTQLGDLLQRLRALPALQPPQQPEDVPALTPAQQRLVQAVLRRLRILLEQDDPEVQTLWESHARELHAVLQQAQALEQAIQGFAFDEALSLLPD